MNRLNAPAYDLFKTNVALLLAAILLLMLLRGCATNPAAPAPTESVAAEVTQTSNPSPAPTKTITASPVAAAIKPTTTPGAAAAPPTSKATEPATLVPEAATPTTEAKQQATPPQAQTGSCATSVASRLGVEQTALVLRRLNLRSDASIDAPILQTSPTGSQVEIIGGPVCTPIDARAYLWWQIRLADGTEGWSAESPLKEAVYFLEPLP
jgi:hypothetical protein